MDERETKASRHEFDGSTESAPETPDPLLELERFGQSYWIDDLNRPMIKSGEVRRRVAEQNLTGVTVNPAIFRSAVHGSDAYDREIKLLAGRSPNEIYEALISSTRR